MACIYILAGEVLDLKTIDLSDLSLTMQMVGLYIGS